MKTQQHTRYINEKKSTSFYKEEIDTLRAEIDFLKSLILQRNK